MPGRSTLRICAAAKSAFDFVARVFGRNKIRRNAHQEGHTFYSVTTVESSDSDPSSCEIDRNLRVWIASTASIGSLYGASRAVDVPASTASFEGYGDLTRSVSIRARDNKRKAKGDKPASKHSSIAMV